MPDASGSPETDELKRWMRDYTPRLLAVARAFASGPVEAEDLLQEAWLKAFEHQGVRAPDVPLLAWLTTITLNVGRDWYRRGRNRARLERLTGLVTRRPAAAKVRPSDDLHPRSRLWIALSELPRLQRDVVVLRIVEDRSTEQTARVLGCKEGTVKASLSRALARLRHEMGAVDPSEARLPGIPEVT